jgi:hypothetical protein
VERKLELLSYVAVKKFEQEQYVLFEQEELEGYIGEFLGIERQESQGVLRAIASQHGLLIERSYKVWSFSHLTFQEYLVAKCYSIQKSCEKLISYIFEIHWHNVFLLTAEMMGNSDSLLKLMKEKIDICMAKDNQLQNFLQDVKEKALSIQTPYKQEAIRAVYFNIANKIPNAGHEWSGDIAIKLDPVLNEHQKHDNEVIKNYWDEKQNKWDNGTPLFRDYSYPDDLTLHPSLIIDFDLAYVLENTYIVSNYAKKISDYQDDYYMSYYVSNLGGAMIRPLNRALAFSFGSPLHQALQSLKKQMPIPNQNWTDKEPPEEIEEHAKWFKDKGDVWLKQLIDVMIEHRNIGHDYQFSQEQEEKLNKYYNVNQLLVDCLIVGNIHLKLKQEIEESLFLPFTEIEKRKREKIE